MTYTKEDLAKLERAMLEKRNTVSISGVSVTFATAEDLVRRIEYVRRQLEQQSAEQRTLAHFSKGVQA